MIVKKKIKMKKKINIWEQVRIVLENDALSLKQKENLIQNLRRIVINNNNKDLSINPEILNTIKIVVEKYFPDLFQIVESEVLNSKRKWLKDLPLVMEEAINIIFIVLVISLNSNKFVSKTVLVTHLTFYLTQIDEYKKSDTLTTLDFKKLNNIFKDTINFDLHHSQVNVKRMSEPMKITWKFVDLLMMILIENKFLVQNSTIDFRPSELNDEYLRNERELIDWHKGRNKEGKKPNPVTIVSLPESLKTDKDTEHLITFFFLQWPQLVPDNLEDLTDKRHVVLRKGISSLTMTPKLKEYLLKISGVTLSFNYDLFLKATHEVDDKLFREHRKRSLEKTTELVSIKQKKYQDKLIIVNNISNLQKIRSILDYFSKTSPDTTYREWIIVILEERLAVAARKKKKYPEKHTILAQLLTDFQNIPLNIVDKIIEDFLFYLLDHFNIHTTLESQRHSLYSDFFQRIQKQSSDKNINTIMDVILNLGVSGLSNFKCISTRYFQSPVNIFDIHIERIGNNQDLTNNEIDLIKESNIAYKEFKECQSDYSLNLNTTFKRKLMELYKNKHFYYSISIGINGRSVIQGYGPHPHAGKIFRFCETHPQKVNPQGMLHLKRAVSFSFKNKFKSIQEHEDWVDNAFKKDYNDIVKKSCQRVESFTYIHHYIKALKNEPVGCFVRLDQVASAITIFGIIAGCDYSKKITNIKFDGKNVYEPYTCIGKDFLKPSLEKLKTEWEKELTNDSSIQKLLIYKILDEVLLPNINEKKICKFFIMPHVYGLTSKGIIDKLIEITNEKRPDIKCSLLEKNYMFKRLGQNILNALNRFSPRISKIRRIMIAVEEELIVFIQKDLRTKKSLDITYTNVIEHKDCTIHWDYKKKKKFEWCVYNRDIGFSEKKYFSIRSSESCFRENPSTLTPLFIQSIDAAILRMTTLLCSQIDIEGVHDCEMSHPNNVDELITQWKKAISHILGNENKTNKQFIEDIWLIPTLNYIKGFLNEKEHSKELEELNKIQKLWNKKWKRQKGLETIIDISDVKSSENNLSYE